MAYWRAKRPPQEPTFISLADVAKSQNMSRHYLDSRWKVLKGLIPASSPAWSIPGSSQALSTSTSSQGVEMQMDTVGFWLATIDQVEDAEFLQRGGIGLIVCLLGEHSQRPKYPPGTVWKSFSVMFESRRDWDLQHVLPSIVSALSQEKNVAVHCLNSFHRGPVGLAAICRKLMNVDVVQFLRFLSTRRNIWAPYGGGEPITGTIHGAVRWAAQLSLWEPPAVAQPTRPVPIVAASRPAASAASSSSSAALVASPVPSLAEAERQLRRDKGSFLYRAMRPDGSDLQAEGSPMQMTGLPLVSAIFESVATGSSFRSPFLHFSKDFVQARHWFMRGQRSRGEVDGYICRVSIADLVQFGRSQLPASSQDVVAKPGTIIDVSNPKAVQKILGLWQKSDFVMDRIHQLGIAHGQQEVLVAFRGRLPVSLFEVVSSDTGLGQGLLPEVGQVPCIDWICKVMHGCAVIAILDLCWFWN